MNEKQSAKRMRAVAASLALPLVGASAALAATPASAATRPHAALPTSTVLVASVKKAMLAAKSVHFELSSVSSGTHEHISADAGASTGRQTITSGKSKANVVVTTSDAYFDGNSTGLSTFFSMPAADITKVGKKWVYAKKGTTQYTDFKDGVISSALPTSFLPTATATKTAKVASKTVAGKAAYEISWTVTSSGKKILETLDCAATGTNLPIDAKGTEGKNSTTTTFSKWGETIKLTAPTSLIAITILTG